MKITKRQLRRIIKEVIEGPDGVWYDDYGNPLQPDDLQRLEDENAYAPMESFKIPYKNYGYEGRKSIGQDRAWLEFVPKGAPSLTREDMFRAVTLLDNDDQEIGLAMATVHAPKSAGPLENYDVYSVYATTTG